MVCRCFALVHEPDGALVFRSKGSNKWSAWAKETSALPLSDLTSAYPKVLLREITNLAISTRFSLDALQQL